MHTLTGGGAFGECCVCELIMRETGRQRQKWNKAEALGDVADNYEFSVKSEWSMVAAATK